MQNATLFWSCALLAAATGLLFCGGSTGGAPADAGVCPSSMIEGEACVTVGEVCNDNGRNCTCEMGRGGGSSWDCPPIGRDGGGFGQRDGGGRRGDGG